MYLNIILITISYLHLCLVTDVLTLTIVNLQNIGQQDIRNLGIIGRVINQTGFVMCARQCEQLSECEGFNFMRSELLCELLLSLGDRTEDIYGWRFVNISSVLQDSTLLTQIRGEACGAKGRYVHLSNNTIICIDKDFPIDCGDATLIRPEAHSGKYKLKPKRGAGAMIVYCDMAADGNGWTVIQKRSDGSESFAKDWKNYSKGFGDLMGEHWLGNDAIHKLTSAHNYTLRIEFVMSNGQFKYAVYSQFSIADTAHKFQLSVGGYSGNATDAMSSVDGMKFSTMDQDNDIYNKHCSLSNSGGWWFKACGPSNLNKQYPVNHCPCVDVKWNMNLVTRSVTMKIKRHE